MHCLNNKEVDLCKIIADYKEKGEFRMSEIHYFQRYSQKENVVTNNTLLLMKRLYLYSPIKFHSFLLELMERTPGLDTRVKFEQQTQSQSSVPDGVISQNSFRIIIETKLHNQANVNQLQNHLNAFGNEDVQVLLFLGTHNLNNATRQQVVDCIDNYNRSRNSRVRFVETTFEKIIQLFKDVISDHEVEMQELIEDYENFCDHENLVPKDQYLLRVMAASYSFELNFKYGIYYDLADRGYRKHRYLGLYTDKSVRAIGEVVNIVQAEYDFGNNQLTILSSESTVTEKQKEGIIHIIQDTLKENRWNISKEHSFFIVDCFYETDYRKVSKYPIMRAKYFNLKDFLDVRNRSVAEIAKELKKMTWE